MPDSPQAGESALAALLVAGERSKQWVACACEQAEAKGVRVGMSLAHARALLKGMRVWEKPFTPAEDAQRLCRLARWAQRFSPIVAADEPDGLLLDMAGCERLFGGDAQMVKRVDTAMKELGLQARPALAPTVGCAWAAARFADDRIKIVGPERIREELAPLPIAGLRIDPAFVAALNEVGIERIGSLFDLPRQELACRFGPDLLRRLDQATGQAVEPIDPQRPAVPVQATRLFDGAVTSLEAVAITVRELLFSLVVQLQERECGARTLDVVLERLGMEPCRFSITLTYPTRNMRHMWTLLSPKIERINLGYGVESVVLHASQVGRLPASQLHFPDVAPECEDRGSEAVLGEFLDRLTDRLGRQAVCRITPVETHVPEEAYPFRPLTTVGDELIERRGPSPPHPCVAPSLRRFVAFSHLDRPSQLFAVPEPVEVISLAPEGPPSWLRWREEACAVRCTSGPERLALPWWETKRGTLPSSEAVRDYYEVQDDQGRLLWVFRDRATHGWFMHGLWA